ncbi:hypothetical protein [Xylanimonas allomyrinae]|uniref:hypothetical protein n=1 Tax=Xylanimonas allomyrinae TaxID=2509459 RepID=UPI0013A63FB5|nr:hypothetical protein [Xylanimonas allomyrinae]
MNRLKDPARAAGVAVAALAVILLACVPAATTASWRAAATIHGATIGVGDWPAKTTVAIVPSTHECDGGWCTIDFTVTAHGPWSVAWIQLAWTPQDAPESHWTVTGISGQPDVSGHGLHLFYDTSRITDFTVTLRVRASLLATVTLAADAYEFVDFFTRGRHLASASHETTLVDTPRSATTPGAHEPTGQGAP